VPKIKCVNEMGDWKLVLESCNKLIAENKDKRKDVADLAVNATVNLGKWDQAREWIEHVDSNNENLSFWNAILSIKKEDYDEAERQIKANRLLIYNQISQLLTFSSNHSADSLIRLQQLFELEEIIGIKRYEKSIALKQGILAEQAPDQQIDLQNRITNLKEIWSDRLVGNTRSLVVWQKIVSVRSLMFNKSEELDFWLDFCKLALKEHKTELCKSTLDSIKQELAGKHQNNRVVELELLELEYKYKSGIIKEEDAIKRVEHFLEKNSDIDNKLKAKMYYKCAIWIRDREEEEISAGRTDQILELIGKSTLLNPKLIKGWHLLGVMYSEVMQNSRSET
jgi:FKBP12-rapamycin complex-associated protein